jgi:hypothetical protein
MDGLPFLYLIPGFFWYLIPVLQVVFAIHVLRTGRPVWWLFVILFFPFVGSLIYFFVEFLPAMRTGRGPSVAREVARKLNPGAEIKRLEDVAALTPTVNNRMELARAYLRAGRTGEAILTYESCAQGIHADDPRLLYETAGAYFQAERWSEARGAFERLRKQGTITPEQQLLGARIYEESGDDEAALAAYAALAGRGAGEEGRTRYALLLKKVGREDEAYAIFDQIVRHARLSSSHYRREEKEWIEIAKRETKGREAGASGAAGA